MGYITARSLATHLPLDDAIRLHFASNCYPPIPRYCTPVAARAVRAARSGQWAEVLRLPDGVTTRDRSTSATAAECVRVWRLEAFVDVECCGRADLEME